MPSNGMSLKSVASPQGKGINWWSSHGFSAPEGSAADSAAALERRME